MHRLPGAEGAGGAQILRRVGSQASQVDRQLDTRRGAQQLEAARLESTEAEPEDRTLLEAVNRRQVQVTPARGHARVIESLTEARTQGCPGEGDQQGQAGR